MLVAPLLVFGRHNARDARAPSQSPRRSAALELANLALVSQELGEDESWLTNLVHVVADRQRNTVTQWRRAGRLVSALRAAQSPVIEV
jgi:hypothetical protein